MLHSKAIAELADRSAPEEEAVGALAAVVTVADRPIPPWVTWLGSLFTVASSLSNVAIAILASVLLSFPHSDDGALAAGLTGGIGLILVVGSLTIEAAQTRALKGYRTEREAIARRTRMWLGTVTLIALGAVHPLLLLGAGISVATGFAVQKYGFRPPYEPFWEFNRHEAAALLSGRDSTGYALAIAPPGGHPLRRTVVRSLAWLALILTLATSSALASTQVVSVASIPAVGLLAFWATEAIITGLLTDFGPERCSPSPAAQILSLVEEETDVGPGLSLRSLSVAAADGQSLLRTIDLAIPPGTVFGLIGPSGAGKSLLLRALLDPYGLDGLVVRGRAEVNGQALWSRDAEPRAPVAVLLPSTPYVLPTSGLHNLACGHPDLNAARGRRILERLIFSDEDAAAICAVPDARKLPGQAQKLLAFARAFLMSPALYLIDRPEDGLSQQNIGALCEQIAQERRLGRSFLMITENRALLDLCDQLVVLDGGRVIDIGPTGELQARMTAGWARLVIERNLESEEPVRLWIRSLFKRPGDEGNRRAVAAVASELLAFSCQTANAGSTEHLAFEFKHLKGQCCLRLVDDGEAPSSAMIARAQAEVERGGAVTPLASILRASQSLEFGTTDGRRRVDVLVETYDPRLGQRSLLAVGD